MARNTSRSAAVCGTRPAAKKPRQDGGTARAAASGSARPSISPVSSQSSRTAASGRARASLGRGLDRQPAGGRGLERHLGREREVVGIDRAAGEHELSGMKAAPAPRWPISTRGPPGARRTRMTVAASRIGDGRAQAPAAMSGRPPKPSIRLAHCTPTNTPLSRGSR